MISGDDRATVKPRRRWPRIVAFAGLVGGVATAVLLALVLVVPADDAPTGDAVIVHAGGRGERLETAVELMDGGAAPTLVVMYLGTGDYPDTDSMCGRTEPYEVICPAPEPVTTIGEAQEIGDLASDRGWRQIVIVSTDYHVRRARLLDERCTDAEVQAAAAGHQLGFWAHAERVGHEMLGLVQAWFFGC